MNNSGTTAKSGGIKGFFAGLKAAIAKSDSILDKIGMLLFHLRKPVMALPVVYYALKLAAYNRANLPEQVGLNLQATGAFTQFIGRDLAVTAPLALTGACLFCMFCSRKATYAWAISIFTLALPILLLVSNIYPS